MGLSKSCAPALAPQGSVWGLLREAATYMRCTSNKARWTDGHWGKKQVLQLLLGESAWREWGGGLRGQVPRCLVCGYFSVAICLSIFILKAEDSARE